MNDLCIYHAGCADGFGAALAVKLARERCDFMPLNYGDPAPEVANRNVYVVDFSFPRQVLIEMAGVANGLIVIDHHKSAQADLAGLNFCVFDMAQSGATLTWRTLFETEPPLLFQYLQDRDLWTWALPDSREVSAAIRSYPFDFDLWRTWLTDDLYDLKQDGKAILRYQQREVESIVSRASTITILSYTVPCLNTTTLISEVGNELCKGQPFSATYFDTGGKRVFSLRSDETGLDVSLVAKQFGGGGHQHAAGFSVETVGPDLVVPW